MYEMMCRERPFEGDNLPAVALAISKGRYRCKTLDLYRRACVGRVTLHFRTPPQDVPRFVSDIIVALLQVGGDYCGGGDGDGGGGDGDGGVGGGFVSTRQHVPAPHSHPLL